MPWPEKSPLDRILDSQYQMDVSGRVCTIRDLYTTFSPNVDLEALKDSEFFFALRDMMEVVLGLPDERSPEVSAYWAKRGMVKEYHGKDKPMSWTEYEAKTGYRWEADKYKIQQNYAKLWTSFVPMSAFQPENSGRKYPVVFVLHGAQNGTFLLEGWGFVQEAARREWIVIIPSLELDDILEEILNDAKALYPVDESRVYVSGFSYGGWASNRLGNQRPDLFAAVAPCAMSMDNSRSEGSSDDIEPVPPFDGVSRAAQKGVYMPIINIYGDKDGNRFPFFDFKSEPFGIVSMTEPKDLVEGVNHWLRTNGAEELSLDAVMSLKCRDDLSETERAMGIPKEAAILHSFTADGIRFHTAGFPSRDGVVRVKLIDEANIPHWPTPEMIRQVFEFFSHFSRDTLTLESVYHE